MSVSRFAVGDRVVALGVEFPATGIITEVCAGDRYEVEWQTDFLTETVSSEEIVPEPKQSR